MKKSLLLLLLGINSFIYAQTDKEFPVLKGEYFGQTPPGDSAIVFAPGFFNPKNDICFLKDGRECYFTVFYNDNTTTKIMFTHYKNGLWTTPEQAPFSDDHSMSPSLADNDQSLYFIKLGEDPNIWKVSRTSEGWSQPEILGTPVNSPQSEYSCNISTLGNMWICSHRSEATSKCDLWRITSIGGQFQEATNLASLNTPVNDCHPIPGPNEDYVIWHSIRPGGFGGTDLYISFANGMGGWTDPTNMGPAINTSMFESIPYLSPDYKFLFFQRNGTIYWISAKRIIDNLKKAAFPQK